MLTRIDVNSDMGEHDTPEGLAVEDAVMPFLTSVNIACGGHAGTPALMRRTAHLAARYGVVIGAHPGLRDPEHFGRAERSVSVGAVERLVVQQLETLSGVLAQDRFRLAHVKPHGALYTMAARDPELARAFVRAVHAVDPALRLFAPAASELAKAGRAAGLAVVREAFADRAYRCDGSLVPRTEQNALLNSEDALRRQLRQLITGTVTAVEGASVRIDADTLCLHSDTPQALRWAQVIRQELESAGVRVVPPS